MNPFWHALGVLIFINALIGTTLFWVWVGCKIPRGK